jgi:hypothetical protein
MKSHRQGLGADCSTSSVTRAPHQTRSVEFEDPFHAWPPHRNHPSRGCIPHVVQQQANPLRPTPIEWAPPATPVGALPDSGPQPPSAPECQDFLGGMADHADVLRPTRFPQPQEHAESPNSFLPGQPGGPYEVLSRTDSSDLGLRPERGKGPKASRRGHPRTPDRSILPLAIDLHDQA